MLRTKLTELKDFILLKNTYLSTGFDNVYQDAVNGLILQDEKPIFPMDNLGDYFYLRLPDEMKFVYDARRFKTDDCGFEFGISAKVYLVAFMRGADSDTLFNNLVNTLQGFDDAYLSFNGGIFKKELVIQQELKRYSKEDIAKALQNIQRKDALVSISFDISTNFTKKKLSCLENPCSEC